MVTMNHQSRQTTRPWCRNAFCQMCAWISSSQNKYYTGIQNEREINYNFTGTCLMFENENCSEQRKKSPSVSETVQSNRLCWHEVYQVPLSHFLPLA